MPTAGANNASGLSRGRRGRATPAASSSTVVHPNGSAEIMFQAQCKFLWLRLIVRFLII